MPENDSAERIPPPRPSTSSSVTHSGSSTVYTRTSSDAPRKMYFGSIRSHSSTTIFSASPSLWSLPTDASHINDPPESEKVIARDRLQSASEGTPIPWKPSPSTVPHMSSVTSLLASPRSRSKKRKLIISGIPPDDERRFEGVCKWCESFGELNSITRAPNGDLHIDFRKAEVADTPESAVSAYPGSPANVPDIPDTPLDLLYALSHSPHLCPCFRTPNLHSVAGPSSFYAPYAIISPVHALSSIHPHLYHSIPTNLRILLRPHPASPPTALHLTTTSFTNVPSSPSLISCAAERPVFAHWTLSRTVPSVFLARRAMR
ncbi:hypothetical protein NUW54_g12011 [Trametes sanguinea]|uniref:Uncharacterized protein n=1 Tax=Trametes sanguinea TaxID=158606 RepID=A0ACC1N5N1_9APHY|nr:hypothetical protein NUW54_g12011 [Trametes sanguinea]